MTAEELKAKVEELADAKPKTEETKSDDPYSQVMDKLAKLKEANDAYDREKLRAEEIRAREIAGGRALAGQPEKSMKQLAEEKAAEMLKIFR